MIELINGTSLQVTFSGEDKKYGNLACLESTSLQVTFSGEDKKYGNLACLESTSLAVAGYPIFDVETEAAQPIPLGKVVYRR